MCAQSHASDTHTQFQLEILNKNVISGIVYFVKIILEGSWNISKTTIWSLNKNILLVARMGEVSAKRNIWYGELIYLPY